MRARSCGRMDNLVNHLNDVSELIPINRRNVLMGEMDRLRRDRMYNCEFRSFFFKIDRGTERRGGWAGCEYNITLDDRTVYVTLMDPSGELVYEEIYDV